jgi:uncharacterized MAPEG superfamily protein
MPIDPTILSLENPVFQTYLIAAAIMILKLMLQPWNEYVDRSRRINLNDLESIPGFLAAGFLFVLVNPPVLLAQVLIWAYVGARAAHFIAYITAQLHDIRATFWTFSSLPVIGMAGYVLIRAI